MSKYIIEVPDYVPFVLLRGELNGNFITKVVPVAELEILNSDYINEHFGELQEDAYKRGYEEGRKVGIKDGMCDAWEAAKKIALMDTETSENVTGYFGLYRIMKNLTPMQAIEKLKAYEDERKNCIEVGDEVEWNSDVIVITRVYEDGGFNWCDGISQDGRAFHVLAENVRKTGKHYDIQSILEAMKK